MERKQIFRKRATLEILQDRGNDSSKLTGEEILEIFATNEQQNVLSFCEIYSLK
jgi:hypothetical protein